MSFSEMVLCFAAYSFVGWLAETVFCSVLARRYMDRGLLNGPFCALYGVCAVLAVGISRIDFIGKLPTLVFIACAIVLPVTKFIASWLAQKLFGLRLWDYSNRRLNVHGRMYWVDVLALGLFGSAVVYLFQPMMRALFDAIGAEQLRVLSSVLLGVFAWAAYKALSNISRLYAALQAVREQRARGEEASVDPAGVNTGCRHLVNAYPRLTVDGFQTELDSLNRLWNTSRTAYMQRVRNLAATFGHRTSRAVKNMNPFTHGVSFHKLVWVFAIGCVLGYLIETAFCLITRGIIESRQGMVYGPFNQVYGAGAVLLTLTLQPLARKGNGWIFAGGALVGGAFEFFASWLQEQVLGTVSWEYSEQAFSIGGRTSLMFMFYWGVLGVFYIRQVYPRISGLIERIPKRQGVFFSWVIIIVLSVNMLLSLAAVYRWTSRQRGIEANTDLGIFLDARFPDDMMEQIYPSMMLVGEDETVG